MRHDLLLEKQAAQYVGGLSPNTLRRYRRLGVGPVFVKLGGRVLYKSSDLDEWLEAHRYTNTAEARSAAES